MFVSLLAYIERIQKELCEKYLNVLLGYVVCTVTHVIDASTHAYMPA